MRHPGSSKLRRGYTQFNIESNVNFNNDFCSHIAFVERTANMVHATLMHVLARKCAHAPEMSYELNTPPPEV
mgnify:CR=1 FL=1